MENEERLKKLLRHVDNVNKACTIVGEKLIANGQENLGLMLIANGQIHDNSKFYGIEWEYLHSDVKESDPEKFLAAAKQHITTNPHHPEYWDGIANMPKVYLYEAVCDWYARSTEFGDNLVDYIKETASKRYGFPLSGKVYKTIKECLELLLETPFK